VVNFLCVWTLVTNEKIDNLIYTLSHDSDSGEGNSYIYRKHGLEEMWCVKSIILNWNWTFNFEYYVWLEERWQSKERFVCETRTQLSVIRFCLLFIYILIGFVARFLRDAGGYDDWPTGRAIFHNPDKTFLVWVNEEDHLRFISMQKGGNLAQVYKRLVTVSMTFHLEFIANNSYFQKRF